jgi:hypothetical protein
MGFGGLGIFEGALRGKGGGGGGVVIGKSASTVALSWAVTCSSVHLGVERVRTWVFGARWREMVVQCAV